MSSKHTLGPWHVEHASSWPFDIRIEPSVVTMTRVAFSSKQRTLDDVRAAVGFPGGDPQRIREMVAVQEANANLIGAAPELLDALKDIVKAYRTARVDLGYDDDGESDSIDLAERIIAKAEGRS